VRGAVGPLEPAYEVMQAGSCGLGRWVSVAWLPFEPVTVTVNAGPQRPVWTPGKIVVKVPARLALRRRTIVVAGVERTVTRTRSRRRKWVPWTVIGLAAVTLI